MPEANWRESLPDEIKANESLASFEDVNALAASYIETKALVGSGLRFPSDEASDADKAEFLSRVIEKVPTLMMKPDFEDEGQSVEFFRTLGMPEESTGYETAIYEERKFDESREEFLRGLAHESRLTAVQYKALSEGMLKFDHEAIHAAEGATSGDLATLRQEWGMTWEERRGLANKVRETFFPFIPETQMDAQTIKALHAVGSQLGSGEGSEMGDQRNNAGNSGKITPGEALAKIDDIMNNREHPYWISMHPNHQKALDDMIDLRKMADPEAGTSMPRAGFGS